MGVGRVVGVGMERSQSKSPGRGGGGANQESCIRVVFSSGETAYVPSGLFRTGVKFLLMPRYHEFRSHTLDVVTSEARLAAARRLEVRMQVFIWCLASVWRSMLRGVGNLGDTQNGNPQ